MEKEVIRNNWKITLRKHTSKSIDSKVNRIDADAKRIEDKVLISDRVDPLQKYGPYIKVKDHKVNFPHNPSSRFLNPCKSNIVKVSKLFWIRWAVTLHLLNKVICENLFSGN